MKNKCHAYLAISDVLPTLESPTKTILNVASGGATVVGPLFLDSSVPNKGGWSRQIGSGPLSIDHVVPEIENSYNGFLPP